MDPNSAEITIIREFVLRRGWEDEAAIKAARDLADSYRRRYTEQEILDDHVRKLLDPVLLESDETTKEPRLARAVHAEDLMYFRGVRAVLVTFFPGYHESSTDELFLKIVSDCALREKRKIPPTVGLLYLGGAQEFQIILCHPSGPKDVDSYQCKDNLYGESLIAFVDPVCWADIGEKNDFQESGIMVCLRGVGSVIPSKETFEKLGQLPSFRTAIDAQDSSGFTAIHLCVMLSRLDVLDFLLVHGPDLSIQDVEGRTAYDLAFARGMEETILHKLLPAPIPPVFVTGPGQGGFPSSNATVLDDMEALIGQQATLFERLPPLLSPSSDLACRCKGVGCVKCSHKHIVGFVVSEIIPTLRKMNQGKTMTRKKKVEEHNKQSWMLVMPPDFPMCPPNKDEDADWKKGWEAEKAVFDVFVKAIRLLVEENPKFAAACFHALRYGWKDNNWESDIDLTVLITDASTGHHVAFLVEVKSTATRRDGFRENPASKSAKGTEGAKAVRQLSTHFKCLKSCLDANLDWVKVCVAFPNLPASDVLERRFEAHLNHLKQEKYGLPTDPILLTKEKLRKAEDVRDWLLTYCKANPATVTVSVDARAEFSRFATWCLLHSAGIVINQVSSRMKKQSKLALLTRDQNLLYCSTKLEEPPLLIIGGPGTGKSFIALEKLKKLEEEGVINAQNPGIYIISKEKSGLRCWLEDQLRESKCIQVYPADELGEVMDFIDGRAKVNGWLLNQVYCVIDQLEDLDPDHRVRLVNNVIGDRRETIAAKMLWITFNPFGEQGAWHWWAADKRYINKSLVSLMILEPPEQRKRGIVLLKKRLRNTTAVSSVLNRLESGVLFGGGLYRSWVQKIIPEPIGDHGLPVEVMVCPSENDALLRAMKAIRSSVLDRGIPAENIIFVFSNEYERAGHFLLRPLDELLLEEFPKTSQAAVPSTAPIPVHGIAKLNASRLDQATAAEWHDAQKYFYDFVKDASSNVDLVNGLDEKLDEFMMTCWNYWERDGFGRYVAFQVISGLIRRASTIWRSLGIIGDIKNAFMDMLKKALEPKKTGGQPDVSALMSLVKKQVRFISFFGSLQSVSGFEAEAVIAVLVCPKHYYVGARDSPVDMLTAVSRAQVQCSLIVVPKT